MAAVRPRDPDMLDQLLKACRSRLDPAMLRSEFASGGRVGVTQPQLAEVLGKSVRYYNQLELGRAAWTPELAVRVAELLRMDETEAATLFRAALGSTPPPRVSPLDASMISEGWVAHVRRQNCPAYISDRAWNVIFANEAYYSAFPAFAPGSDNPEPNVMVWLLTRPEAEEYMVDWYDWAVDQLNHVRSMYETHRDHPGLQALMEKLKASPRLDGMWEQRAPDSDYLPDTVVRRIRHPEKGEMEIQVIAGFPFSPDLSASMFVSMEPV